MPYNRAAFVTQTPMESLCFDFMQEEKDFIADAVFTPKAVQKADMKVYQVDTSKLRQVDTRSKTQGEVKLIDEQFFSKNINLVEYKLGKEINPRDVRDSDIPAMLDETRGYKIVTQGLLIDREIVAANLVRTAANYPSGLSSTLTTGSRWDDAADPEQQKQAADTAVSLVSGIKRLNAMACDIQVVRALRSNRTFIDRVKYTSGAPITAEQLKQFFDVDYVFVAGSFYDSANEGGTRTLASPWGKDVLFYYYNPSPVLEDVSFAHMYIAQKAFWTKTRLDETRNGPAGSMKIIEVGTEYMLDKGWIESSASDKFSAGYLYKTVIA